MRRSILLLSAVFLVVGSAACNNDNDKDPAVQPTDTAPPGETDTVEETDEGSETDTVEETDGGNPDLTEASDTVTMRTVNAGGGGAVGAEICEYGTTDRTWYLVEGSTSGACFGGETVLSFRRSGEARSVVAGTFQGSGIAFGSASSGTIDTAGASPQLTGIPDNTSVTLSASGFDVVFTFAGDDVTVTSFTLVPIGG